MAVSPRAYLEAIFAASLEAADAGRAVLRSVRAAGSGGIEIGEHAYSPGTVFWVVALGKAAAPMARAFISVAGSAVRGGLAVTGDAYGHSVPAPITLRLAGHPVPDSRGREAAAELLEFVAGVPEDDVLVVLLSGGASAMSSLPAPGLDLVDLVDANRVLLGSGADIHAINTVRKHCSGIAGGRLAMAAGCGQIELLAVSDVPGDAPTSIGSGPCTGDPSRFADALDAIAQLGLRSRLPAGLLEYLEAGDRGEHPESPKPGHPGLARVTTRIVASNAVARSAALDAASARGEKAVDLGEILAGEARSMGRRLAALARSVRSDGPILLVAGGETVVTLVGSGQGGRSQELALAAALEWEQGSREHAMSILAVGSDGADGPTDAAGAYAEAGGFAVSGAASLREARERLRDNDSHTFFASSGGLVRTGPTDTNVMDLVFLRIEGDRGA